MFRRIEKMNKINEIMKFIDLCDVHGYDDLAKREKESLVNMDKVTPKQCYAWIGINPEPGTISMKELFDTAVAKLPYAEYSMVVEQNTQGGVRPHLHILAKITANTRKNHIVARMGKIFNIMDNFVQVRVSYNPICIEKWTKYIQGDKSSNKLEYVEKDIKDREKENIPHIYICPPQKPQ